MVDPIYVEEARHDIRKINMELRKKEISGFESAEMSQLEIY